MKIPMTRTSVLIAISMVAAIGGTLAIVDGFDISLNPLDVQKPQVAGAFLTGNVKVKQIDETGNIIAYRQSDNHIVANGMKVIIGQVFNKVNETYAIPVRSVTHMEIGDGGEQALYANQLRWNNTQLASSLVGAGCLRDEIDLDNSSNVIPHHAGSTSCTSAINCFARFNVTLESSFSGATCGFPSIDEAGVFTDSTGGLMFARNTFGSVTLMALDTLQLNWEFTFTDS